MSSPKDMFDNVLKEFKERVREEELQKLKTTNIGALKKELKKIQDEQKKSKSLRNLRRIQCFVEAVQQLLQVIDLFLNTSEIACLVWGPVKFLLQVLTFCVFPSFCSHNQFRDQPEHLYKSRDFGLSLTR
jgi:hypothetical protein